MPKKNFGEAFITFYALGKFRSSRAAYRFNPAVKRQIYADAFSGGAKAELRFAGTSDL